MCPPSSRQSRSRGRQGNTPRGLGKSPSSVLGGAPLKPRPGRRGHRLETQHSCDGPGAGEGGNDQSQSPVPGYPWAVWGRGAGRVGVSPPHPACAPLLLGVQGCVPSSLPPPPPLAGWRLPLLWPFSQPEPGGRQGRTGLAPENRAPLAEGVSQGVIPNFPFGLSPPAGQ